MFVCGNILVGECLPPRPPNERTNESPRQSGCVEKRGPNLFSSVCRCPPFLFLSLVLSLTGKKGQVVLLYRYTILVVGKRTIGFRSNYVFPVSLGPRLLKYIVRPIFFLANANLYLL